MERVSTEVLIIGGGLAAMMAALEASAFSPSTLMVSKGKVGKSGATLVAGSNFAAVLPDAEEKGDRIAFHIEDTLAGGGYINDLGLVRTLAENAPRDVLLLEKLGVKFIKKDGYFDLRKPPGHRYARAALTYNPGVPMRIRGKTITDPLTEAIHKNKIALLEGVILLRLIVQSGRLTGAIALSRKSGEVMIIECKAAVIATGGAGTLYEIHTNPNDLTADSYSMAMDAGCTLRDMEFVQFYPTVHLKSPRIQIPSPVFADGAVLRDRNGERFLAKYEPVRMEMTTRDVLTRAIYREVEEGRGIDEGVYLDLTPIPNEVISVRYGDVLKLFQKQGINLTKDWIPVAPAAHFFMGGIVIDEHCRTSIPGVFAAGEATGGVHGANRLSGNGLSDPLVFGRISGKEAALWAEREKSVPVGERTFLVEDVVGKENIEDSQIVEIKKRIKHLMWKKVGIVRNRTGVGEALEELESMQKRLNKGRPSKESLPLYFEIRSMLMASGAIAQAAMLREESRGAHFREDFPVSREEMAGSIFVEIRDGRMKAYFRK